MRFWPQVTCRTLIVRAQEFQLGVVGTTHHSDFSRDPTGPVTPYFHTVQNLGRRVITWIRHVLHGVQYFWTMVDSSSRSKCCFRSASLSLQSSYFGIDRPHMYGGLHNLTCHIRMCCWKGTDSDSCFGIALPRTALQMTGWGSG